MSLESSASVAELPQPHESAASQPVTGPLVEWIDSIDSISPTAKSLIIDGIRSRSEKGQQVYGRVLSTHNGRPSWVDLWQELLDALQYMHKEHLEGQRAVPDEIAAAIHLLTQSTCLFSRKE